MSGESTDLSALARDLVAGVGNAFWCNRIKSYVTRDQCVAEYLRHKGTGVRIPCLECSKVLHWAKHQKLTKNESPHTSRTSWKKENKKMATVKKMDHIIHLDFSEYGDLLDNLKVSAKENFRTPDQQLLYLAQNHVAGRAAKAKAKALAGGK